MIEPSKIKEAFKKVEDENYAFRTYLKIMIVANAEIAAKSIQQHLKKLK